jgi:hypothetical protein
MPRKQAPAPAPAPVAEVVQPPELTPIAPGSNEVGLLDQRITAALNEAKAGGLPMGFIVAVLQAHALRETQALIV